MATIENNMSTEPHIYTFEGVDYDLQISMYVISQFEDYRDLLTALSSGAVKKIFKVATAMMNNYIEMNQLDIPHLKDEYVMSKTSIDDFPKLVETIADAMGFKPQTKGEKELDALADAEGAKDIKN